MKQSGGPEAEEDPPLFHRQPYALAIALIFVFDATCQQRENIDNQQPFSALLKCCSSALLVATVLPCARMVTSCIPELAQLTASPYQTKYVVGQLILHIRSRPFKAYLHFLTSSHFFSHIFLHLLTRCRDYIMPFSIPVAYLKHFLLYFAQAAKHVADQRRHSFIANNLNT